MKVITYLGITLFSVFIQFALMELFQERLQIKDNSHDLNDSSHNILFSDILQRDSALFYRKVENTKSDESEKLYGNQTTTKTNILLDSTTEYLTTSIDILYDENVSVVEDATTAVTSTDYDNVTEITLFEKNITTITKTTTKKKDVSKGYCACDLLYQSCDIGCCCDSDCTASEYNIFTHCNVTPTAATSSVCNLPALFRDSHYSSRLDDLFCIVKTNIPKRRKLIDKFDTDTIKRATDRSYKWQSHEHKKPANEFTKRQYMLGDPLWLLRNGSIYYMDLPSTKVNNYCSSRKPVKFLKADHVQCIVKLNDLEIIQILGAAEETVVISPTIHTLNNTALNCTTLYCVNWTIIICDSDACSPYNKSRHEPTCTENVCSYMALNIDYIFHYHEEKIINATIRLHSLKLSLATTFMTQTVSVKFYLGNESEDKIVELSGDPGYIYGLPIVISYAANNYTHFFFNTSLQVARRFSIPDSKDGLCTMSNITRNYLKFGVNARTTCLFSHSDMSRKNEDTCKTIQRNIEQLLDMKKSVMISPYGNPKGVKDEEWLLLAPHDSEESVYGVYHQQNTKLLCHNIVTGISFIFTYADVSTIERKTLIKIISAQVKYIRNNVSVDPDDLRTTLNIDTNFIDITNPVNYEYAGPPSLNIRLPGDFFFPNNLSHRALYKVFLLLLCVYFCDALK